jgi:hypothetical protein
VNVVRSQLQVDELLAGQEGLFRTCFDLCLFNGFVFEDAGFVSWLSFEGFS